MIQFKFLKKFHLSHGFRETLEFLRPVGELTEPRLEEIVFEISGNSSHKILVATDGTQVVGSATLLIEQKIIHNGGKVGHIEDVVVHKKWEGRGIGRELVKKLVEHARMEHCYKVILNCSEEKVGLYEKYGFHRSGVEMRVDL